ncbi:hypothetical protein JTE90_015056 [Oedothorax gibbosus]|uniref:Uncharacterized protein n=1 Tax=Oedothorax gibbosus TaxID=931172 RepID=A0AAV6U0L5_9ARAC|nr:hypothetical protein JTE90_015056 [Oedothorax gibbosus]
MGPPFTNPSIIREVPKTSDKSKLRNGKPGGGPASLPSHVGFARKLTGKQNSPKAATCPANLAIHLGPLPNWSLYYYMFGLFHSCLWEGPRVSYEIEQG